jgi:hypothetical protein
MEADLFIIRRRSPVVALIDPIAIRGRYVALPLEPYVLNTHEVVFNSLYAFASAEDMVKI